MARALALAFALLAAAPLPPAPTRWVTDDANLLSSSARASLDARLEAAERATGHQVIVWIGAAPKDDDIDAWAARAFEKWGIGQRGKDDGVVLFIFPAERTARIEVGYGLEPVLPDAIASRILGERLEPGMRANQPDAAVTAAVEGILARVGGGAAPTQRPESVTKVELWGALVAGVLLLALFAWKPRLFFQLLWLMSMSRGGGRGGGWGGSGGGGFKGGGGRSGGGGARRSW